MKVLHIEAGKHLYGGALQVVYLIRQLSHDGVQNLLVAPEQAEIFNVINSAATCLPTPMKGDLDWRQIKRIRAHIRQHRPDIVHVHSRRGADLFALLAAKKESVPVIVTRRVDNTEASWFARWKYHSYDRVAVISDAIRNVLIEQGVDKNQLQKIYSAVDTEVYQPSAALADEKFRQQFNLPSDAFVIGIIAQLIERKGHRIFFNALEQLISDCPNLRLICFGQGPLLEELQKLCIEKRLENFIQFAGFRTGMPGLIPNMDLLVHPAYKEGLGVSLLQASACEVPIIACRAGGVPEVVEHEVSGLLVEPGDSNALEIAVRQLINDPKLARELGSKGRKLVINKFSIPSMASAYKALYQSILNEKKKPD